MKLIVGLGNPGSKYAGTRHNIGREVLESIAAAQKVSFKKKKSFKALTAEFDWDGMEVCLALPETFMNLSGQAAAPLAKCFEIPLKDMLVVVDEIALPFGKLRLRSWGSAGGHNGLKSIEQELQSQEYPRLRVGVGGLSLAGSGILADYVLAKFTREERAAYPEVLKSAAEACRIWATQPITKAMNAIN